MAHHIQRSPELFHRHVDYRRMMLDKTQIQRSGTHAHGRNARETAFDCFPGFLHLILISSVDLDTM